MSKENEVENFNDWAAQFIQKSITEQFKDKGLSECGTDWNNIDLERGVERDKNILEPYSFETLLLEIHCNLPEINPEIVKSQFKEQIMLKTQEAWRIFHANLDNIVKYAQKERDL